MAGNVQQKRAEWLAEFEIETARLPCQGNLADIVKARFRSIGVGPVASRHAGAAGIGTVPRSRNHGQEMYAHLTATSNSRSWLNWPGRPLWQSAPTLADFAYGSGCRGLNWAIRSVVCGKTWSD